MTWPRLLSTTCAASWSRCDSPRGAQPDGKLAPEVDRVGRDDPVGPAGRVGAHEWDVVRVVAVGRIAFRTSLSSHSIMKRAMLWQGPGQPHGFAEKRDRPTESG